MMRGYGQLWDTALALLGTSVDMATLAPLGHSVPCGGKSRPTQPIPFCPHCCGFSLTVAQVAGVQLGLRKS